MNVATINHSKSARLADRIVHLINQLLEDPRCRKRFNQLVCAWAEDPSRRKAGEMNPVAMSLIDDQDEFTALDSPRLVESAVMMAALLHVRGAGQSWHDPWSIEECDVRAKERQFFQLKAGIPFAVLCSEIVDFQGDQREWMKKAYRRVRDDFVLAGSTASHQSRASTWRDAQLLLIALLECGHPYLDYDYYARSFGCSRATITKAFQPPVGAVGKLPPEDQQRALGQSARLQGWRSRHIHSKQAKKSEVADQCLNDAESKSDTTLQAEAILARLIRQAEDLG